MLDGLISVVFSGHKEGKVVERVKYFVGVFFISYVYFEAPLYTGNFFI